MALPAQILDSSASSIPLSSITIGDSLKMELEQPIAVPKDQPHPLESITLQNKIIARLWPLDDQFTQENSPAFDAYLRYFRKLCVGAEDTYITSYLDIVQLVDYLRENQHVPRKSLLDYFISHPSRPNKTPYIDDERKGYNSIEFCVRLWLMIDIRQTSLVKQGMGIENTWTAEQSLQEALGNMFPRVSLSCNRKAKWPSIFQARNLEKIGGFEFTWSNDLREHLALDEDEDDGHNWIHCFQHMAVIERISKSSARTPFPDGFLDETLDTVALLIRRHKPDGRKWFNAKEAHFKKRIGPEYYLDSAVGNQPLRPNTLLLKRYQYWGESLEHLKAAFDDTEPRTLKQWLYNKRQRTDFWNFTITVSGVILAVLFGFTSTLIGAMQVYLLYRPPYQG